ncbi:MAG: chorismate synthase [Anaerolineae bacterium]|nr:chorismate synthase [Anaerolineae bacterium]
MEILGGPCFAVAGAGESHGPAYTTIVNGCPPGLPLSREAIQSFLDRRRPGGSRHGTSRSEADQVLLLSGLHGDLDDVDALLSGPELAAATASGVFSTRTYDRGVTTGEPIAAVVLSAAKRSADYAQISGPRGETRPGHADLVKYHQMRGYNDPRGGGRASYRATISDVIGGSIARIYLQRHFGTVFLSSVVQVGPLRASRTLASEIGGVGGTRDRDQGAGRAGDRLLHEIEEALGAAAIPSLDATFADEAAELIESTRDEGDSLGSLVEVIAINVPPLVGSPLYGSLKLRLMGVLGGLNAARSCEVGAGLDVVTRRGSENNDPIRSDGFQSNNHGGMLGGITTGMPLVCRVGFKPTSSIQKPQKSVRQDLTEIDFQLRQGRHDPCVGVRAGITLESRMAIELLNAVLVHQTRSVDPENFILFRGASQ